jgi:hypothetical protein
MTRETVMALTPAAAATSRIVARVATGTSPEYGNDNSHGPRWLKATCDFGLRAAKVVSPGWSPATTHVSSIIRYVTVPGQ